MATLTHAESRRLYSWWWSSHMSPKNSKWLQENLTDMDSKVKSMIKLIEEDADSFARRAEMYYKKRPELMKLVEDFYRAYRALAERYDSAMGELRQAHRTMAEAFPNQIPFAASEDSLSSSSEAEPRTPQTPHPIRSLLNPDDLQKEALGSSLHAIKRNGAYSEDSELNTTRKGLKQLNEMFGEGRAHSGFSFQDEEQRISNNKFQKQEAELKSEKVKKLQDELSKLSIENQNLTSRILLATENSDKVESEVQTLRKSLSTLETEKEAAALQYQECKKKLYNLEAEISREREVTSHLSGFEDRCRLLENANQSLQLEVDALLNKTELQEKEIMKKEEDVQKLDTCIKKEQLHLMHAKAALESLESLQSQSEEEKRKLALELQIGVEKLGELEFVKKELEQEVQQIKENNHSLRDQNLSSDLLIRSLQDEVSNLKKAKQGLEEEVRLLLDHQSALQQQIHSLKGDIDDLGRQHQHVILQIESVGFNAGTFQSSVKELQDEHSNLKNIFMKEKDEKLGLLKKLGDMEKILEKNYLLENSLSDANIELEGMREKLKDIEESFHSLQSEKTDLLTEKGSLISQVDHIAQNFEKLSETNLSLENSLSDLTVELDGFRVKSKSLEESCLSLQNENYNILSERDTLVSRVDTIQSSLEELERRFSELEDKNSCLDEEKELALHQINQLELLLAEKKEKHSLFVQSSKTQLADLENQICILREQAEVRKRDIEKEQEQLLIAHTEVLVLQSCVIEMKQINDCLLGENQKHVKSLLNSENLVLELRQEMFKMKEKVKFLVEKNVQQRMEMNRFLKSLDIETVNEYDDKIDDHVLLNRILGKAENYKWSLLNAEDEIERIIFERSICILVLEEMRDGALDLKSERNRLEDDLKIKSEELSLLQNERCKILEMCKLFEKDMEAGLHREMTLKTERDALSCQLSETQKAHRTLANENYELLEENQSWKKEFCFLRDEKYILEEEYYALLREALALGCLSQVFESYSTEKASELRELCSKIECLHEVNCDLKKETEMIDEKVGKMEVENLLLKESVSKLECYRSQSVSLEDELLRIKSLNEELCSKTEIGKHLLSQREIDLTDALVKLEAKNEENIQLHNDAESLKEEICEAKRILADLQKNLTISEGKARHDEKAIMELLAREEWLKSELNRRANELETSEMDAVELYKDLQVAGVLASVFEQKVFELIGKYESLEEHSNLQMKKFENDKALRDANDEELGRKLAALEAENDGLKCEVTAILPLILSLRDSVCSLEGETLSLLKIHDKDLQVPDSSCHDEAMILARNKENNVLESSGILDKLQAKVQAVTKAVVESKNLFMEENLKANVQLEAAKTEIDELKSRVYMVPDNMGSTRNLRWLDEADISYMRMKDIQLDYVSSRGSPRLTSEACAAPSYQIEDVDEIKIEKELVVDKVELSNKLSGRTQEGSKRMLERLISDAQRLTNIQASVQDLENKIERADKGKLTTFEYDSLMAQLKDIEGRISQLFEMKGKLTKNAEEETMGSGRKMKRVDETGHSRRRQVSEQARRWSEKIGRVELEVRQIRFLLLKLEEEFERKEKRNVERRRVQLRDYLYGVRQDSRKKKQHMCMCAPLTKED